MTVSKILEISGSWCAPCRQLKKELENFNAIPILEFDADENEKLCSDYHIRNVPTLIFVNENDEEIARSVGFIKKEDLEKKIEELNG